MYFDAFCLMHSWTSSDPHSLVKMHELVEEDRNDEEEEGGEDKERREGGAEKERRNREEEEQRCMHASMCTLNHLVSIPVAGFTAGVLVGRPG